jgi:hypothetical protein
MPSRQAHKLLCFCRLSGWRHGALATRSCAGLTRESTRSKGVIHCLLIYPCICSGMRAARMFRY